jgi:hypothetical protein
MNTDSPLKLQSLDKYGPWMKKEEVAEALHLPRHIIAPLARDGLLEMLGKPKRYCVKLYSRDVLAQRMVDPAWQDRVAAAIHRHWRRKNALKRAKQAGNDSANGNPATMTAEAKAGESVTR